MLENIFSWIKSNERLKWSVICTFILGFITHGYRYTNVMYGHDAASFSQGGTKIGGSFFAGRWFSLTSSYFDGGMLLPLVMGFVTCLFMSIFVYAVCVFFDVKNKMAIILIAGATVTNYAIIMAHFYDPIDFTFAGMWASLSILCICRIENNQKLFWVFGIIFAGLSAASYPSYMFILPTACLIKIILDILGGKSFTDNVKSGCIYLADIVGGFAFYYIVLRIGLANSETTVQSYMGEGNLTEAQSSDVYLKNLIQTYKNVFEYYFGSGAEAGRRFGQINIVLMVILVLILVYYLVKYGKKIQNKLANAVLFIVMTVLLPIGLEGTYIISGASHYLMKFQYVFFYILIILVAEKLYLLSKEEQSLISLKKIASNCLCLIMCVVIYYGVIQANACYTRWDMNMDTTIAMMTSIQANIEACPEFTGEQEVVFVGKGGDNDYIMKWYSDEFSSGMGPIETVSMQGGKRYSSAVLDYGTWGGIWNNVLRPPFKTEFCWYSDWFVQGCWISQEGADKLRAMPCYPEDGSISEIEGYIVVKVGHNYSEEDFPTEN